MKKINSDIQDNSRKLREALSLTGILVILLQNVWPYLLEGLSKQLPAMHPKLYVPILTIFLSVLIYLYKAYRNLINENKQNKNKFESASGSIDPDSFEPRIFKRNER